MKKLIKIAIGFAAALTALWMSGGCDDMNKTQEKYASREEIVYLTKVDSISSYPGVGKVKFVYWY